MGSPLGLTTLNFQNQPYSFNPVDGIGYTSQSGSDTTDPNYTEEYNSLFNGTKFYYRPSGVTNSEVLGSKRHKKNSSNENDMYDISTNSIIEYTSDESLKSMKLKPADFIYLKDFGVYPNNRLITCRRFPSPVENDLTAEVNMRPLSTIVSWIPDDQEEFFSFETSEEWNKNDQITDPLKELSNIFNDVIGKTVGKANPFTEMSGGIGGAANLVPIGGIAEALEIEITNYFLGRDGEDGTNFSYDNIYQGNPNFMGESAWRNTNSIRSKISIPIKCVYEMKFINGIDPTIAFMDILQNLLRFSSSQSVFYLAQSGSETIKKFIESFKKGEWLDGVKIVLDKITEAIGSVVDKVTKFVKNIKDEVSDVISGEDKSRLVDKIKGGLSTIASSALSRYRIKFAKLIPAMSGMSSAPWHLTIGNPKNPFFSSGDMVAEGCKVTFGNVMGFNDIPTKIEYEFTITSARNLGIQEIFDRFNIGSGREYQRNGVQFDIDFMQGKFDQYQKNESERLTNEQKRLEEEKKKDQDYYFNNPGGALSGGL